MEIKQILREEGKLLELLQYDKGFQLILFCTHPSSKSEKLEVFSRQIESLDQFPEFKKYFDTLEELKQCIQLPSQIRVCNEGRIQLYANHPVKTKQQFKLGEIDLKQKRVDLNKINRLCISERELENSELKSIILRMSQQLELVMINQKVQEKQIQLKIEANPQICPATEVALLKSEEMSLIGQEIQIKQKEIWSELYMKIKQGFEQEIESLRQIFARKLQHLSNQVESNKMIVLQKLNQMRDRLEIGQEQHRKDKNVQKNEQIQQDKQEQKQQKQQEENEENKEEEQSEQGIQITSIKDIKIGQCFNLWAKIFDVSHCGRRVIIQLGDATGVVTAILPRISMIKQDNTILIQNCFAKINRDFELEINLKRNIGHISVSDYEIQEINFQNDISETFRYTS